MKKVLLCVLLSLLTLCVLPAYAERLSVSVAKANVRSGPGKKHERLWSAGKYYPVDTVEKSGRWYKIRDFEGDVGWIHGSLLGNTPAVIVKGEIANVRKGPGTNYKVLFQAEKGVSFKLLKKEKKWLNIKHADGDVGWIHKSLVWGH